MNRSRSVNRTSRTCFKLLTVCAVGLSCGWWNDVSRGEQFPLPEVVPHSVPAGVRATIQQLAQKHADGMYNHLLLYIDWADRAADLSATQNRRLTVAAKGAVQKVIDGWIASLDSQFIAGSQQEQPERGVHVVVDGALADRRQQLLLRQRQLVQKRAVAQAKARAVAEAQLREVKARQRLQAQLGGARFVIKQPVEKKAPSLNLQLDIAAVAEQVVWRLTWQRTLADKQRARLAELHERRHRPRNSSHRENIVTQIDQRLLLDSTQRKSITVLVDSFLQSPTTKNLLLRHPSLKQEVLTNLALKSFNAGDVTEILSPAQRYHWDEMTRPRTGTR